MVEIIVELIIGVIFFSVGMFNIIKEYDTMQDSEFIFLAVFVVGGLFLLLKSLIKIIKNKKTTKKGEICYGLIQTTKDNGISINDNIMQDVYIYTYIPSLDDIKIMKESIGFKSDEYIPGYYVQLKYYKNDINIIKRVSRSEVPANQLAKFDAIKDENINNNYYNNQN